MGLLDDIGAGISNGYDQFSNGVSQVFQPTGANPYGIDPNVYRQQQLQHLMQTGMGMIALGMPNTPLDRAKMAPQVLQQLGQLPNPTAIATADAQRQLAQGQAQMQRYQLQAFPAVQQAVFNRLGVQVGQPGAAPPSAAPTPGADPGTAAPAPQTYSSRPLAPPSAPAMRPAAPTYGTPMPPTMAPAAPSQGATIPAQMPGMISPPRPTGAPVQGLLTPQVPPMAAPSGPAPLLPPAPTGEIGLPPVTAQQALAGQPVQNNGLPQFTPKPGMTPDQRLAIGLRAVSDPNGAMQEIASLEGFTDKPGVRPMTPQEIQQRGLNPYGSYSIDSTGKTIVDNAPENNVNFKARDRQTEGDQKIVSDALTNAQMQIKSVQQMGTIQNALMSGQLQTSPVDGLALPVRNLLVSTGLLTPEQAKAATGITGPQAALQAMAANIALHDREPGMGALRNFDINLINDQVAKLENPVYSNLLVNGMAQQYAQYQVQRAALMRKYYASKIGDKEQYSLDGFDEYMDKNVPPPVRKLSSDPKEFWADYGKLPKGAIYQDPDGAFKVKGYVPGPVANAPQPGMPMPKGITPAPAPTDPSSQGALIPSGG